MDEVLKNGAFGASLLRNNKQIKSDRAIAIVEGAEILYKRKVEDLEINLKQMKRDQESMLDLSPDNVTTLKVASDFDAEDFVKRDVELGIKIRNTEIAIDIAKKRYEYLFKAKIED